MPLDKSKDMEEENLKAVILFIIDFVKKKLFKNY
jgi:hypothetical protein